VYSIVEEKSSQVDDVQTKLLQSSVAGDLKTFLASLKSLQLETIMPLQEILFAFDGEASSCLHLSAGNGHAQLVQYIVRLAQTQTKDVCLSFLNHKNDNNHTALLLALANGYENIACNLLDSGAAAIGSIGKGRNALYLMAKQGMLTAIKMLIERDGVEFVGKLASEVDNNGYNSLHAAVLMGQKDMAAFLLGSVNLKMECFAKDGCTVLHVAARSNLSQLQDDVDIVNFYEMLVQHCHPDILRAQDSFGMTPLHSAGTLILSFS
jgi:ankyrin repeat protein